ncbi:MAG: dipeptide/oligopeptide/nickel ABC transporter ATP-binding protein [Actinomycetota bacterium]|nr:dipeptide/oligopeptide/nickel ABC transporter ATP-binding protein [Actinomycetota bacterium]
MMLEVQDVSKTFFSGFWGKTRTCALEHVSLAIDEGQMYGLIGGSGSGKTTLSRVIMGFVKPDSGSVLYEGQDLTKLRRKDWRPLRCEVQMIFQNPQKAFNPRFSVYECCAEPIRLFGLASSRDEERQMVYDMLDSVGITRDQMNKYPHEISGGQAQRIAIVRALCLEPRLLICDEPTSMLDVSVQAQIIRLLSRINEERGCAVLFISHDLDVVRHLCDMVSVMHQGKVVEQGETDCVFGDPQAEFTKELLRTAL